MARYALVRNADGMVRNVAEVDDASGYTPPPGHTIREDTDGRAEIGGRWNGTAFEPAPAAPPPDPQIGNDRNLVATFLNAPAGSATAAQRDEVLKAVIRYLRRMGQE